MNDMNSILYKLQFFAETTPEKVCLINAINDTCISYSSFWKKIKQYSVLVQPGKNYILQTKQSIEHMIAFYGIQLAGSVAIPVEATASIERLQDLADQFDAEILPREYSLSDMVPEVTIPEENQVSCIICTTGTTGKSKGVMSSFNGRFCGADNVRYSYDITPNDIALVPQVLSHSGGLRRVEAMLVSGATAVILGATMLFGNVFGAIKKYKCNILQFVPAQVSQILNRAEKLLVEVKPQLRIISVGSAVISEHDKEKLRELLPGVRLFNDFGSTEAIGSAYFEWSSFEPKPNCVGLESIHSKIVFLDDDGNVIDHTDKNNPGIIATEGGTLMIGYLNAPELTANMIKNNRVLSADLGYRGDDGMIYILGRRDDIIVSGANKISPVEIEDVVLNIPGIKECACVPKKDAIMGQMPALFIVWEKDPLDISDIINIMTNKLDRFKIPKKENIIVVSSLPRTEGTGKIIKRNLIERIDVYENS